MSFSIFYPIIYLFFGIFLGKNFPHTKKQLAFLLSKIIIPIVIVFNIATYQQGVFTIMLWIFLMMGIMLFIGQKLYSNPVKNLCFFYLNIGWLGLPIASSIFGETAAKIMIAAYIGSSLFGNTFGVHLLLNEHKKSFKNLLKMPPVWALLLGIAFIPIGEYIQIYGQSFYQLIKFLMSFFGMAILGIWLAETSLTWKDIRSTIFPFLIRLCTISILMSVFIIFGYYLSIPLITQNPAVFYLIALLPPAANIIVLETHYRKSGQSAPMIAGGTCVSMVALAIFILIYQII